ncbi:MAG: VOC family protein [Patulibacter sp.]
MIHHVGLEVAPEHVEACVEFWRLLGWQPVERPEGVDGEPGAWLARNGCHLHLQGRAAPTIPYDGHVAIVDPDLDATAQRLTAAGYELLERTRYWGARRIFTRCPAGHRVELMNAPPASP